MALTVLVTGFEPFEADAVNPAWEVARALDGWRPAGATVYAAKLACVFGRAMEQLELAMALRQPQLVICLGLASGRGEVSLERVAINVDDARIPDNDGKQPVDLPIVAGGPAAYFSTLPIKAIVRDLRAAGLSGAVSNSAGTFVCNHVFYGLMHQLARHRAHARGGFVHLPCLPEQAERHPGLPTMPLAQQLQAMRVVINTALAVSVDVRESAGRLH
jgi:pyroglutamyl-peptidase